MENLKSTDRTNRSKNEDAGLAAFETGAAVVEHPGRGILRLAGKDPVGMLNAILTNDVPPDPNRGAYALLLNPKGRIQTDLRVSKAGEDVLVDTEPEGAEAAREILGRYAPFSRVRLEDLAETHAVLGLYGPEAKSLLGGTALDEHQTARVDLGGASALAVGVAVPVPGYDLILAAEDLATARDHLTELGAIPATPDVYETARVNAGVPRFGADVTPENFPGETGLLDRAVDFRKGCYPGQETVARMHYRGHPNRTLHRVAVEDKAPVAGAVLSQDDVQVGTITSVAPLPSGDQTLALCYLSRKADPDASLALAGGSAVRVLDQVF